jgi:hypothetical protein
MPHDDRRDVLRKAGGLALGAMGLPSVTATKSGETEDTDEARFAINERVSPIVYTNTYAYPDPDSYVMGTVKTSIAGYVRDGPSTHDGIRYYLVEYNSGVRGWTSETNLTAAHLDYIPGLPYFYQYDNSIDPTGTCGNTSVAMVLNYYGASVSPDDLSWRFGDAQSTRPPGATEAFNTIAAEHGLDVRASGSTTATIQEVRRWIDQGRPVITWGMFTPPGHIVVTLGHSDDGYTVNDPAGDWNERYQGTHYGRRGEYIVYDTTSFENVVVKGTDTVDVVVPNRSTTDTQTEGSLLPSSLWPGGWH